MLEATIHIKPLSVNQAWQGRRFKTPKYKAYELELLSKLDAAEPPIGDLTITLEVGYSNRASDIDNCLKPLLDILQKKYQFNDNRIYRLVIEKTIVPKGQEYIKFKIEEKT